MSEKYDAGVECCEESVVHSGVVERVRQRLPQENAMQDLAELFKVFGDTTRIRILFALYDDEVCVCDLAEILNMTQSAISHQLRLLKRAGLVSARRSGKSILYSLADDHVHTIMAQGWDHIME